MKGQMAREGGGWASLLSVLLAVAPVCAQMNTTSSLAALNVTESMASFSTSMPMMMTTSAPMVGTTSSGGGGDNELPPKIVDPVLGEVQPLTVVKTFAVPPSDAETTLSLDGDYADIKLVFPSGAWPAGETRQPTMQVLEAPAALENSAGVGRQLGGPVLSLGPEGIMFSTNVTVTCPVTASKFVSGREYSVFKVVSSGGTSVFQRRMSGSGISGDTTPKPTTVDGSTNSFSLYVVMGETPPIAAVVTTTPKKGRACGDGCIAGAVIGSVFGAALIAAGGYWIYMNKLGGSEDDRYAPEPIGRQQARDDGGDDP